MGQYTSPGAEKMALDWKVEVNCSDGGIYCMLYRYDMSEEDDKRVDRTFYRLNRNMVFYSVT